MKHPDNYTELTAIANHRQQGQTVVFTNGCFDILHLGHARYLTSAKSLGSVLVVGLNSDASVRRLKGPSRPIVPQQERKELLLSLKPVDYVVIFEEDTPLETIKLVRPNVLVKGGDWSVEKIVGADVVSGWGGKTMSLKFEQGYSTTDIIKKIKTSG